MSMSKDRILSLLNRYNAERDDLIRVYDMKMSEKRGEIITNLKNVLAVEVWYIEEQESLNNAFYKALRSILNEVEI